MKNLKVVKVDSDEIVFDNGFKLSSYHDQECCEHHYLHMADLTLDDFEGLEFDLSNGNFFNRVPDYGIELIPVKGFPVRIPGYGSNNGYYSDNLYLNLSDNKGVIIRNYDISECQF